MIVKVVTSRTGVKSDTYTVEVRQGCQSFRLDYHGNLTEARWYAKMFRRALKLHTESTSTK